MVAAGNKLLPAPSLGTSMTLDTAPSASSAPTGARTRWDKDHPHYKWVALSNTTLGTLMATINGSIVIISLPAIFRGIGIDPLQEGNVGYLLWMIMGFLLVSAVLVVTFGRLGDMYGRVRVYTLGFVVFTIASLALGLDPVAGGGGAMWLIVWRIVQGVGSAMLFANSTAILTDAFPARQRGLALGINQVSALAGSFLGLIVGGLLAELDWRAVFWVSAPIGLLGTIWSYRSLHEIGTTKAGRLDWPGNLSFAVGLSALLIAITYGIQPYGGHTTGWLNPWVLGGLIGGVLLLGVFCLLEARTPDPMFDLSLFRIRAFSAGDLAGVLAWISRGGLQFMLIIWLQGIWLPLHGYTFESTPLWAAIYLLPLTIGFLLAGPLSGALSDRFGARWFATGGLLLTAATYIGLFLIPVDFPYWLFALMIGLNRGGVRAVRPAQRAGDHEQRARRSARDRVRHARDVLQLRDVAVHRHLLLADDRGAGEVAAADPVQRTAGPGRQRGRGRPGRPAAPGGEPFRGLPRLQPDRAAARADGGARPRRRAPGGHPHRWAVLPAADLRAVPHRPGRRLHRRGRHVRDRSAGVPAARRPVRARRGDRLTVLSGRGRPGPSPRRRRPAAG